MTKCLAFELPTLPSLLVHPTLKALSPEQIEEAKRLYKEGWSLRKIAKRFRVGVATIKRSLS
jgi:DNA invertase Pin-like site-specific DNA recombinase